MRLSPSPLLPLRSGLAEARRAVRQPRRLRHTLEVWLDYRRFRRKYGAMFQEQCVVDSNRGTVLIVSLSDRVYQVKLEGFLAKTLETYDYHVVILTSPGATWAHRYFGAYGLVDLRFMEDYGVGDADEANHAARAFLAGPISVSALKNLYFHGAAVGRHVLSSLSRVLYRGAVQLDEPETRGQLAKLIPAAMGAVLVAERLLDDVRPDAVLFNEKGYSTFGSICDAALSRGLNVVQFVGSIHGNDSLTFKRYTPETRRFHPQSLSDETWERVRQILWTQQREAELAHEFRQRYEGDGFLGRRTQTIPSVRGKEAVRRQLGLETGRPVAVIFSHMLWDANMFYGEDLFEDQEEWFIETIRAACANPAVSWVVKLHPANVWKGRRESIGGELNEKTAIRREIGALPSHVTLLEPDVDINPYDLFALTDYGVTIRGTIGLELPCFGKPVLTAGTGRYSGRGFTVDSTSTAEYLTTLRQIQTLPLLSKEQVLLAKKHAYALFRLRPWHLTSLSTVYKPIQWGGHPLEQDLAIHLQSADELRHAEDLRRFVSWLGSSRDLDYLEDLPAFAGSDEAPREKASLAGARG